MTINFISTAEFRAMNVGLDLSKYDETTLSGVLSRATNKVEDFIGYTLPFETITNEKSEGHVNSNNDLVIFPRKYPVESLISAKIVKGSFESTINLSTGNYDIPSRKDEICIAGDSISLDTVTLLDFDTLRLTDFYMVISYTAGYQMSDRPPQLIDAINLYARDEINRSLNTSGAYEVRQGGVSIKYGNSKGQSDNLSDANDILATFKRVVGW
jgi:hypothetical protein